MWLSPNKFKRKTSDARFGAIILYILANKRRGDKTAIDSITCRLPHDVEPIFGEDLDLISIKRLND